MRRLLYSAIILFFCQNFSFAQNEDSRIRENGAEVILDGSLHVTGAVRANRYYDVVGISTPTTPSTNHARMFLTNSTKKICSIYDNATVTCLGDVNLNAISATQPVLFSTTTGVISATLISLSTGVMGTLQAAQEPAHTGDVTNSAGSLAMTAAAVQANIKTFTSSITVTNTSGVLVSSISFSDTANGGVRGTNTNDNAASGMYGEYKSSSTPLISVGTSAQYYDVVSLSLTPGDWDCRGAIVWQRNGATISGTFDLEAAITSTAGNSAAGVVTGMNYIYTQPVNQTTFNFLDLVVPITRFSLSATTTVYLKGYIQVYSAATPKNEGALQCRRIR